MGGVGYRLLGGEPVARLVRHSLAARAVSGGGHPPTEPGDLSPVRRVIAIGTLLFVLLFMPTPWMSN